MKKQDKFVSEQTYFNLMHYQWDDQLFSDILMKNNPIDNDRAMDISRFMREEIANLKKHQATMIDVEQMIKSKLLEHGLSEDFPIRLDNFILVRTQLLLSDNAKNVLERRYLKKDSKGKVVETPEMMFKRVAGHIAKAEKNYGNGDNVNQLENVFYNMMAELKFLPNSPTLMNAGRRLGQLAACFVLPVEDSMEGIFDALKNAAIIHKSGGGTGFSFSRLRPKDSRVGTTGGIASGPVSFMKIFNTATEQVKQGGTRRGANMAILRIDHPDIMEFICCKKNKYALNNFNISVGVTDTFMEAVNKSDDYHLIDPRNKEIVGQLPAGNVYRFLVEQAWDNGDPGIIFLDRINRDNPTPALGDIESTNPCGEQPLLAMESCNLGSIDLSKFITTNGKDVTA